MKAEQITSDEWDQIEKDLDQMCYPVCLECDGYLVILELDRVGKMRLGITVHVNGWLRGKWLLSDKPSDEGCRFFPVRSRSLYRGEHKKMARKALGKKEAEKKITHIHPFWTSARSLRRHFIKHNRSIRRLSFTDYREALEKINDSTVHVRETTHEH